ncbi:MAG: hypothetical protein HOV79_27930 [Hamadaea sp.]|nr:hypothetical protein [Hamadaea sp.]
MNFLLAIRLAFAGGRESLARMTLMVVGTAIGVGLLLLSFTALPIMQTHIDRLAWHRTDAASPATAPDPAMWLAVTDRYDGRDVIRVHVAALGPQPPVPPGVQRLPGPGEVVVSPALADLLKTVPDDQLRDRFPGRIVGTIGPEGLIMPAELVGIVGRTPEQMRATHGAYEIQGIEQPGERLDLYYVLGVLLAMLSVVLIGPVIVFIAMVSRVGGARREVRFAAIRLAGATRYQTAVFAATETVGAALAGTVVGWLGLLAVRPVLAQFITLGHGMPIYHQDLRVPTVPLLLVLLAVPVLAGLATLVSLAPVQITPLGTRRRVRRRTPGAWRLVPVTVGILGTWYLSWLSRDPDRVTSWAEGLLSVVFTLSIVVGLFLAGAWVCAWISRGIARLSRTATTLIVARRIAADPYSTFRAVSGVVLAMYAATSLGLTAASAEQRTDHQRASVLEHGVVAVHVQGMPEASLGPLLAGDVVVARRGPGQDPQIVVACADLARVSVLRCPLPQEPDGWEDPEYERAEQLFTLPYDGASGADFIFGPRGFAEPSADTADLPIQTLFIRTDGSAAAQERLRTLAATVAPLSRSKTSDDLAVAPPLSGVDTFMPLAMVFILIVSACTLTVSVINSVMERRRPFALLRASGVRLGELRRIVLLETGVPMAATVLLGVGVAMLMTYALAPPDTWVLPSGAFFVGLGLGAVAAFLVSLIALPFMDLATRHDNIRFE